MRVLSKSAILATVWASLISALSIRAESPDRIIILSPPQQLAVGACSQIIRVQFQSQDLTPSSVSTRTVVRLGGDNLRFYSDPQCSNEISDLRMSAAVQGMQFYFRATQPGYKNLTVSSYSLNDDSQVEVVRSF